MQCHAIFGPPGTGKSTRLASEISILAPKYPNMAVMSFSRAAAQVLASKVNKNNIRFVGTIHSLAFNALNLSKSQVVQVEDFSEWYRGEPNEISWALSIGQYAYRHESMGLAEAYKNFSQGGWVVPFAIVEHIVDSYINWKRSYCLIDFDDMLIMARGKIEPFDVVVVDEAQDLSPIQWELIKSITKHHMIISGDDDQALFRWCGADPHGMLKIANTTEVLSQSYRVPRKAHALAESTIKQVTNRVGKRYSPIDLEGIIHIVNEYDPMKLKEPHTVLCRDKWTMKSIEEDIVACGLPYNSTKSLFHSAKMNLIKALFTEDIKNIQRLYRYLRPDLHQSVIEGHIPKGHWQDLIDYSKYTDDELNYMWIVDPLEEPKITLSTIHSFKGKEDDHIVLCSDCGPTVQSSVDNSLSYDDEIRVWYVGCTRTKNEMTIVGLNQFIHGV